MSKKIFISVVSVLNFYMNSVVPQRFLKENELNRLEIRI
jgi:hypothetical protein